MTIFDTKFANFTPKTGFLTKIPVYGGSKKPKKITKNDDKVSGFFGVFWSKSQYMGPSKPPKPPKTVVLVCLPTPPLRL